MPERHDGVKKATLEVKIELLLQVRQASSITRFHSVLPRITKKNKKNMVPTLPPSHSLPAPYPQVAAAANEVTKAGLTVAELSCDGIGVLDFSPTDPGGCRVALANVFLTPIGKVNYERSIT